MCINCGTPASPYSVYNVQYVYKNDCVDCANSECASTNFTSCIFYKEANLLNSGIVANDSLTIALQKIDAQLAGVTGNYAGYNINCLGPAGSITTEAQFVQAITAYVCNLNTSSNTFTGTTFPAYQTAVDSRFDAIEVPGITHAGSGIVATDTLQAALNKMGTKFNTLDTALSLSGVNWTQCFAVAVPPTTIAGAFSLLVDQICQVKTGTGGAVLPTFNNIGSVLTSPGATDSLESTVIKLRDRVNLLPTFDINALSWNALSKPSTTAINLQAAVASILAKLDSISQNMPTFDGGDFVLSATDGSNVYAGKTVALGASLNVDRFVAVDGADTTPGTLIDKLFAGTGISLSTTANPGKITITSSGTASTFTVKANSLDSTPDFLDNKVQGALNGAISINTFYDGAAKKVTISPNLNIDVLIDEILAAAETDETIKNRLCTLLTSCPSPCSAPLNPQIIAVA